MSTAQVTLRVPLDALSKVDALAKATNATRSKLLLEAVDLLLKQRASGSAHEKMKHLCGIGEGAAGASTSKAYLERYGRD